MKCNYYNENMYKESKYSPSLNMVLRVGWELLLLKIWKHSECELQPIDTNLKIIKLVKLVNLLQ